MNTITYPLLCFELEQDAILGILVGTDYQVVDRDIRNIKATMSDYLQKLYKKYGDYPYVGILEPKLKIVFIKTRPTYKAKNSSYPLPQTLKIPVFVVYGQSANGYYECYLPLFNESFYYYNPKQFNTLVTYFATSVLNHQPPRLLYRRLLYSQPTLDKVSLRVNYYKDVWMSTNYEQTYPTLSRLAERYPHSKTVRKNISAFPEAAWELENHVNDMIERELLMIRTSVIIVGYPGTGKSSVLKQAIKKITTQTRKHKIPVTFWQIMPQRITATSKYLGQWQQTCEGLIEDLKAANGILWVVDLIRLLQIGGEGPEDSVAAFLTTFLQQNNLQLVGEVSPSELDSIRRLLPGFVEHFQLLYIKELPEPKIYAILQRIANFSHQNLKIAIGKSALELTYRLLSRYYPYESFPGKAVKFLGQCVSAAVLDEQQQIDTNDIISQFIHQTGMPELFLRDSILLRSAELEDFFQQRIIGQSAAIEQLCNVVKIFKAGLNNPNKPISTMVFAGPTGVGKTASARALADYFFGKGQKSSPLIRIDMSEFQHPAHLSRFIGSGKDPGKLVQEIRERPFAVVLLDEIEKADSSIFDSLLTVLDEGRLVDAFGRVTNFRNTIIILTTNLGASNRQSIGFGTEEAPSYLTAISSFFRPEFVNRLDAVVTFNALSADNIRKITTKELHELKQREGFVKRKINIQFTERVVEYLATMGFDERYGARPLQRTIEQEVTSPLAHWILNHQAVTNCWLKVDYNGSLNIKIDNQ